MKYTFKELIDVRILQDLTDQLYQATGIPSAVISIDGEILTGSGWQRICKEFHRQHPLINKECIESDIRIREKINQGEPFVIYECPRHLTDASAPIIVEGEHVANVFAGQLFTHPPDLETEQLFRQQARKFNFDEEEYIKAFREIPVMPISKFRPALNFLCKLAHLIARMGLAHMRELEALENAKIKDFAIESSINAMAISDLEGKITNANPAFIQLWGYTHPTEILGRNVVDFWKTQKPALDVIEALKTKGGWRGELVAQRQEGSSFYVQVSASMIKNAFGKPLAMLAEFIDITEQKTVEEMQSFLLKCGLPGSKEDFFHSLAHYLAQALEMDYVCIDRLLGDNLTAETLAIYFDGRFEDNQKYTLNDTPCGQAAGKIVCAFPERVRHLFPKDKVLQDMLAESYVGVTLWDSLGRPIGLIAVIGRRRLADTKLAKTILQLAAVRAAGELERRQTEMALRESERTSRSILDNIPDPAWLKDCEGRFIAVNRAWTVFFGLETSQVIGKKAHEFLPDEIANRFEEQDRAIIDSSLEFRMEEIVADKNHLLHWFETHKSPLKDEHNTIIGIIGIARNITGRKKIEDELNQTQRILQVAMDHSTAGIAIADAPSGKLRYVNDAGLLIRGSDRQTVVNGIDIDKYVASWQLLDFDGKPLQTYEVPLVRAITLGETCSREFIIRRAANDDRIVLAKAAPIRDEKDKVVAGIVVFVDITERKKMEEELKRSLDEKIILLNEVHHRVKNNLQIVASLLNLQAGNVQSRDAVSALNETRNRVLSMALLHEFLYKSGNLARIDFEAYIKQLCEHIIHSLSSNNRNISLEYRLVPIQLAIEQAVPCGLIINELLSNAYKHGFRDRQSGNITIEMHRQENNVLKLCISDDGNGLPTNFDIRQSPTLGIRLIASLARQLGGKLSFETTPLTVFCIIFPIYITPQPNNNAP